MNFLLCLYLPSMVVSMVVFNGSLTSPLYMGLRSRENFLDQACLCVCVCVCVCVCARVLITTPVTFFHESVLLRFNVC